MSLGDTALEWVGAEKLTGTATAEILAIFPVCRFSETRGTKASAVSPGKWLCPQGSGLGTQPSYRLANVARSLGDTALEWVGPEKLTGTATAGILAIFPVCRFSETRGPKASAVSPES